uniref:Laminin G domain-containing protein n=1 Tax=Arion vulgaris TaxID=1028688 RepID=A0A0B7BJW8_9EUPU
MFPVLKMDFLISLICLCVMVIFAEAQITNEGPCFNFKGDSYLHFTPNNFDSNNSIHYTIKFRTLQDNGILMYARGRQGDDEALFIKNGKLQFHLFNTAATGIEGYFGAHLEGDETVNIDKWITVHVYRSWEHYDKKQRRMRKKTGFEVQIDGNLYSHVDYFQRSDISIQPPIYFGGYRESLSSTLSNFIGQIKDISEEKNKFTFENPSLNYGSRVEVSCVESEAQN